MSDLPDRYARGWYVLGHRDAFPVDATQSIDAFGTQLSVTRDNSGKILVVLKGQSDNLLSMERNNLVFCWHDVENNTPDYEPEIIAACNDPEWSDWHMAQFIVKNNCRELVDNMADKGHFGPVHKAPFNEFFNEAKGHTYSQIFTSDSPILGKDLWSKATYEGPAYMTTYMSAIQEDIKKESRLLVSHVPINMTNFMINFGCMVKKDPNLNEEENKELVAGYVEANNVAFGQDVRIWENKIFIADPLVCEGDGPLHRLRKWYAQFYVDYNKIPKGLDLEMRQF